MSQTYTDDCFAGGHVAQTDMTNIEANFAALKSAFSGTSTPSNTVAGMWWFDTTANILKLRNEANDAWLSIWDLDGNTPLIANSTITDAMVAAANKDGAAGTASMRTLGTGAAAACAGNDSRLTDNRTPSNGSVTPVKLDDASAGNIYIAQSFDEVSTAAMSYTKVKEILVGFAGTFRITFDLRSSSAGYTAYGRVYKNGAASGTARSTNNTSLVTYSQDISSFAAGDKIQVYIYSNGGTAYAANFKVGCSGFWGGSVNL